VIVEREDSTLLLAEVGRFARERVAAATARPETPIGAAVLEQLSQEAAELGLLSPATGESGFGIWEQVDHAGAMAFNIGALTQLGRANPGVAFAWHRIALARWVAGQLALELDAASPLGTTLVSTGHYGLARTSVARWLKSAALHGDEVALLADWLDRRTHATIMVAPHAWQTLLCPVWSDGRIAWQLAHRDSLDVQPCRAQHGLDELAAFQVRDSSSMAELKPLDDDASRLLYGRTLKMDMIGLLAIGAGALVHGQELATGYAAIRTQGGKIIAGHPAVQAMLADIEIARHHADVALASFARPIDDIDAGAVAATRASTHALLCDAANQVVQLHGGIGYMCEAGPEKIVRDQNMLKLQSGGTREAHAFLAGWIGAFA
jgi:acyl-CoA dehydrogenase